MQIQKISPNYNQYRNKANNPINSVKSTSFGHRTEYPVIIANGIMAQIYEPGRYVLAYHVNVGDNSIITINRNLKSAEKKLTASVYDGHFDIEDLPKTIEEYYQECLEKAKKYFKEDFKTEL